MARKGAVAERSVERAMERRRAAYEDEVRRLVDASFSLIREEGRLEPKVGEIVAEAGLSNQAFYKHFRSKDELLLAVLDEGIGLLRAYLEHRIEKQEDPVERIRSFLSGLLEQALNRDAAHATRPFALSRVRLSELFPSEVRESEHQLETMLAGLIRDAVEAGELPDADADRSAAITYNLAMSWVERALADLDRANRKDADYLVTFAISGLRHTPPDRR